MLYQQQVNVEIYMGTLQLSIAMIMAWFLLLAVTDIP